MKVYVDTKEQAEDLRNLIESLQEIDGLTYLAADERKLIFSITVWDLGERK